MIGSDEHDVRRLLARRSGRATDARLTGSAGVAEYPRDGEDLVAASRRASSAAAQAEAEGGDRVAGRRRGGRGRKRVDVALVEDDEVLARLILDGLATRGYRDCAGCATATTPRTSSAAPRPAAARPG